MRIVVGIYTRLPMTEIERLAAKPALLRRLDARVALADGRALDLGRRWEELGCLLDGGILAPRTGPTVGEQPLASPEEDVAWSFVTPERVREIAAELGRVTRDAFMRLYEVDDEDTADAAPGERTERVIDQAAYLFRRLEQLRDHYRAASAKNEAMLVRIGERPYDDAPDSLR